MSITSSILHLRSLRLAQLARLAVVAGAALTIGCGSSDFSEWDESPNQSLTGLPKLSKLDSEGYHSASFTSESVFIFSGDQYELASPFVTTGEGGSILLNSPDDAGLTFALYEVSDLGPSDGLIAATVNADVNDPGAPGPGEYYLATAWFESDEWVLSGSQVKAGSNRVDLPPYSGVVSPFGKAYVAVIVPSEASLRVVSITIEVALHGRTANHVESGLPESDAAGVDIAFPITVVDADGYRSLEYNGNGSITTSAPDAVVVQQPVIVEGAGTAVVRFPTPGDYTVGITGMADLDSAFGDILVYETKLPIYRIDIDPEDLDDLNDNPYSNTYQPGNVNLDGVQFDGIEMHYRGSSARDFPKKSWKIKVSSVGEYADPDWNTDRKILNLNSDYTDPTLMREMLSYRLLLDLGVVTPRARFVHLRVNNVFQGVYTDVEEPSKAMLRYYGINDGGALYQAKHSSMHVIGAGTADDYVGPFDKETRTAEPYTDIALFIENLNGWSAEELHTQLPANFDVAGFTKYMVGNTLVGQADHLRKNYFVYNDELGSGKWMVIPWDYDLSWGHNWDEIYGLFDPEIEPDNSIFLGDCEESTYCNALPDRFLEDDDLYLAYITSLQSGLDTQFSAAGQTARIDAYYDLIIADALADWQKRGTNAEYDARVAELKLFLQQRREFIQDTLDVL